MAIRILDSVLPPATVQKKGGVIVGEDLDVTPEGVITIGGVVADFAGKTNCMLYSDGINLSWKPLTDPLNISRIDTGFTTNTYLAGNQGNAIINSTAGPGTYITLARYQSTNGKITINGYQGKLIAGYTSNTTINAGTNALDKQVTIIDENGNSSFPANVDVVGTVTAPTFNGNATSANYSDLAEKYESDIEYPIGTLIKFGGKKQITIADVEVNGVISEKPGVLLNRECKGQPIVLSGKTKIRVIGRVRRFNKLVLSKIKGVARVRKWYDIFKPTIAISLCNNTSENEKLVECVTKLTF